MPSYLSKQTFELIMNSELFAEVARYITDFLAPQDDALITTIESLDRYQNLALHKR